MKALLLKKYGPPEALTLGQIDKPAPGPHEVLVRVHAAAINDFDWGLVRGRPRVYRLMYGLIRPKHRVPGMELAGTIEAVGENVKSFAPGDAVYGDISEYGFGALAEYVCVPEQAMRPKPPELSFADAASLPHAGGLALQGLRDVGKIQTGQKILINGAGGGVGVLALQIAKLHGATVTGVDTGAKLSMMKDLGYDCVLDFRKEDFSQRSERYDLILDCKTNRSPFVYARCLNPGGTYVTVGGALPRLLQVLLAAPWIARTQNKRLRIVALKANKDLEYLGDLYKNHQLRCVVDGPYAFSEAPARIRYFGEGRHSGKVVLTLRNDRSQ
ncbi:MAG: NAD(P)-dependent alcohol dehydrogenase [Spirochaetales bacterium]|nr:NAD(P)-dependent alcohol dehydrogenase [Spirochaetales bacterium]